MVGVVRSEKMGIGRFMMREKERVGAMYIVFIKIFEFLVVHNGEKIIRF